MGARERDRAREETASGALDITPLVQCAAGSPPSCRCSMICSAPSQCSCLLTSAATGGPLDPPPNCSYDSIISVQRRRNQVLAVDNDSCIGVLRVLSLDQGVRGHLGLVC